jgi:hypothetical protein
MPLVHRKSGWFWGSKGPFPSKAKALQVARAAYASGYREKNEGEEIFFCASSPEKKQILEAAFAEKKVP